MMEGDPWACLLGGKRNEKLWNGNGRWLTRLLLKGGVKEGGFGGEGECNHFSWSEASVSVVVCGASGCA